MAELAEQDNVTVDQPVRIALACPVSAWRQRDTLGEWAKRGSWEQSDRVMARVRDVLPLPGDEE